MNRPNPTVQFQIYVEKVFLFEDLPYKQKNH